MRRTALTLFISFMAGTLGAQNLLVNPDFDSDANGWVILPAASWTSFDVSNSADSGSVYFANSGTGNGGYTFVSQCLAMPAPEDQYLFGGYLYNDPASTTGGVSYSSLWWYSEPDCSGFISADNAPLVWGVGAWTMTSASGSPPTGTQSALITFTNQRYGDGSFDVHVDHTFIEVARIFEDGFENGDTTAWNSSSGRDGGPSRY